MSETLESLGRVRRALASEPRIGLHGHRVGLAIENGALVMAGELPSVAAKKLALEAAAAPETAHIVDRLRVEPGERQGDRQTRDLVRDALVGEPALAETAIYVRDKGTRKPVRVMEPARGEIDISVVDGVVTFTGCVPSESERDMAENDAWYTFDVNRVFNRIEVRP